MPSEGIQKVFCIDSRKIFDAKIIDAETKFGGTSVMFPKTGCIQAKMVSVGSKLVDEVLVRKECSLFESVHAFFHSDVDITSVSDKSIQTVLFANSVRERLVPDVHKFRILHGRSKKMILEISTEKKTAPLYASEMVLLIMSLVSRRGEAAGDPASSYRSVSPSTVRRTR